MSTKRVILANGSRLLREMLHSVINKAGSLEVVEEIPQEEHLPSAIERFDPEWVIISAPQSHHPHSWINACMAQYPSVRFIFLGPDSVKVRWQVYHEHDLTNLSLRDFIHVLERDPQHT